MIPDGTAVRYEGDITRFHGVEGNVRCRVVRPDEGQDYYVVNLPGAPFGKVHALEHELHPVTELRGEKPDAGEPHHTVLHRDHAAIKRAARDKAMKEAGERGFLGEPCPNPDCGAWTMVPNGTCKMCITCKQTTGCS